MSSISFNSNLASLRAGRQLSLSTSSLQRSFERLSTGLRINRASDDAAGLAIADQLRVDQRLFAQAQRNINDGLSLLNIAESSLEQQGNIIGRLQELAEQAANGAMSSKQRFSLDREYQSLLREFGRIASTTNFNGLSPLLGTRNGSGNIKLQVGIDGTSSSSISVAATDTGAISGVLNFATTEITDGGGFSEYVLAGSLTDDVDLVGRDDLDFWNQWFPNTIQYQVKDSRGNTRTLLLGFADTSGPMMDVFAVELKADNRLAWVETGDMSWGNDFLLNFVGGDPTSGKLESRTVDFTFADGAQSSTYLDVSGLEITGTANGYTFGKTGWSQTSAIDFSNVQSVETAKKALSILAERSKELTQYRGNFGAAASRLLSTLQVLAVNGENVAAAESQIRSVDISEETARLAAAQIRQRAAAAVLSQANQGPSLLLSLLL